jgi:hypothetical protein
MGVLLGLLLVDRHTALVAGVGALTLVLLMVHDVDPLNHFAAVNAWHLNVWARCLMHFYFLPETLGLADSISLTLNRLEVANLIVMLHLVVAEHLVTAEVFILAHELHLVELLFNFLLDRYEAGFLAHHRALASLFGKLVQTNLMKSLLALFTLPWLDQDSLAQ